MKDRQPTQILTNGAIRYGVYNANGTLDRYEYLKREDAPTVEGTPLNKANLLSDATAAKLWPNTEIRPEDPTLNDALVELQKGTSKIGDILITARAKPSDAWLLCNGQSVAKADYPELFSLLRSKAAPGDWTTKAVIGIDRETNFVQYVNSKWFAFAHETTNVGSYENAGTLYVYVSEDTNVWNCYSFTGIGNPKLSGGGGLQDVAICYSAADDAYYLALEWYVSSSDYYSYAYSMQADFSAMQRKGNSHIRSSNREDSMELYAKANGTLYLVAERWTVTYPTTGGSKYTASYTALNVAFMSSDHAATWTSCGSSGDRVDYDPVSDKFLIVKGRNAYIGSEPLASRNATLLGTIPTSIISESHESDYGFVPYVCAATNTIVVIWEYAGIHYAYSTDRGVTWYEGTEPVLDNNYVGQDHILPGNSQNFVNGLLIFNVAQEISGSTNAYNYIICSLSDPSNKVYKTVVAKANTFLGALSDSGMAIYSPSMRTQTDGETEGYVKFCDYGALEKDVPTIIPDSRSHAYIKALEE